MTPTERAAFAAQLASMTGDELQTLLSQGTLWDDPERYWMIKAEADHVWREYLAEVERLEVLHGHKPMSQMRRN